MRRMTLCVLSPVGLLALAACSEATDEQVAMAEIADSATIAGSGAGEAREAPQGDLSPLADRPEIQLTLPKMAYVFDYGFRLAADAIAPLQQKHADLCEEQGPYTCQIVSLSRSGDEGEDVTGEMQLAVAADKARGFAARLSEAAEEAGAESFKADIRGEDLSKSIVDTEARVRSRIALRDRLMDVLETQRGTVAQLVEAERGVAQVNEEIDQARSWLKEMQGRVGYSRVTLTYETANPGGSFLKPIHGALDSVGSIVGTMLALLIVLLSVGIPLLLVALGVRRLKRRFGNDPAEA